ncbi:hypothetical protein DPMN_187903 [Dreissena polymorpha]|uniref:Uncharacterized protein n=1 Tax=Dreissena polymorpha TaxID=45954 RepID=A0A9D4DQC4_DREPO|nr:hypothetical protein DPMN_187903 [Dreissena polymorpha]
MSNIEILVNNGNKELLEIFRDTIIWILDLRTADCILQASDILHTLCKLEMLLFNGSFTSHFATQLPASLNCISLQTGECSSEWLYSLFINLCALGHHVKCEFWYFVVQSRGEDYGADAYIHGSLVRSKLVSCKMSNMEILVINGSKELFEIFRDTSIGILDFITADCILQASDILPTLSKLEMLLLWGSYTGHFAIQLPASLQFISLETDECSSEWLCSLLINLCALGHLSKFVLWDFVMQSRGEDAHIHGSHGRYKVMSCDMSYIKISVKNCLTYFVTQA